MLILWSPILRVALTRGVHVRNFGARIGTLNRIRPGCRAEGNGAGDETRTRGLNLGKVVLYQLSYPRTDLALDKAKYCITIFT